MKIFLASRKLEGWCVHGAGSLVVVLGAYTTEAAASERCRRDNAAARTKAAGLLDVSVRCEIRELILESEDQKGGAA